MVSQNEWPTERSIEGIRCMPPYFPKLGPASVASSVNELTIPSSRCTTTRAVVSFERPILKEQSLKEKTGELRQSSRGKIIAWNCFIAAAGCSQP